jgi:hypothetical protein
MTWRRKVVAAALLLVSCREATPAQAPDRAKPELFLLTPLPIVWSEGFGLDQPGSPALKALEQDYQVTPIDLPSLLPEGAVLLAAQPRALPAEELVALDGWVRRGGRLLLLADPMLEWESKIPLGDPRRAPIAFPDTGLLQHWGLRLDAPDERGPRNLKVDADPNQRNGQALDLKVMMISPGALIRQSGSCEILFEENYADCPIGKGRALVVADADWLNDVAVEAAGGNADANFFALRTVIRAAKADH